MMGGMSWGLWWGEGRGWGMEGGRGKGDERSGFGFGVGFVRMYKGSPVRLFFSLV